MEDAERKMLEGSFRDRQIKIENLNIYVMHIKHELEEENKQLHKDEYILEALRLSKSKFVNTSDDFDGEDLRVLDQADKKYWNQLLKMESFRASQISEANEAASVYEITLKDIQTDINNLTSIQTDLEDTLHVDQKIIDREPVERRKMDRFEKITTGVIFLCGILLFWTSMEYLKAEDNMDWIIFILSMIALTYVILRLLPVLDEDYYYDII